MANIPNLRSRDEQVDQKFVDLANQISQVDRKLVRHDVLAGAVGGAWLLIASAFGVAYHDTWSKIADQSQIVGSAQASAVALQKSVSDFKALVEESQRDHKATITTVESKLSAVADQAKTAVAALQATNNDLEALKKLSPDVVGLKANFQSAEDVLKSLVTKIELQDRAISSFAATTSELARTINPDATLCVSCRFPLSKSARVGANKSNEFAFHYETTGGLLATAVGDLKIDSVRHVAIDLAPSGVHEQDELKIVSRGEIRSDTSLVITAWTDDPDRFTSLVSSGSLVAVVQIAVDRP